MLSENRCCICGGEAGHTRHIGPLCEKCQVYFDESAKWVRDALVVAPAEKSGKGEAGMTVEIKALKTWRETLTREMYIQLKTAGLTDAAVRMKLGIGAPNDLTAWKKDHGCEGIRRRPDGTIVGIASEPEPGPTPDPDPDPDPEPQTATPTPAAAAKAANELQAEIDADTIYAGAKEVGLTITEALDLLREMRDDINCCKHLLKTGRLTNSVAQLIQEHQQNSETKLSTLEGARVVI